MRLAVALRGQNEILGMLLMGPPAGRASYGFGERRLLRQSADQLALMVENARLTCRSSNRSGCAATWHSPPKCSGVCFPTLHLRAGHLVRRGQPRRPERAGGAAGLGLALTAIRAAVPCLPADLPRTSSIDLDWRVLAFTAAASLATSMLFGLTPLLQLRRVQLHEALTHGVRVAGGQSRLRSALVVTQVAVTLLLLVGAGLMVRSLCQLLHVPLGFAANDVLAARMTLPRTRYPDAGSVAAFQVECSRVSGPRLEWRPPVQPPIFR